MKNADPYQATSLINNALNAGWSQIVVEHGLYGATPNQPTNSAGFIALLQQAGRDLTWRRVPAGTDAFRFQYVSGDPSLARAVLEDVLGEIDRTLPTLQRGGDRPVGSMSSLEPYAGIENPLDSLALKPPPIPVAAIPFDDERAGPTADPKYRALRLIVIDAPILPSRSQGTGWWAVVAGCAAGWALSGLVSLWKAPGWLTARKATA